MLKAGCWVLSIWAALNLVASLKIVVDTLFLGGHTPALFLLLSETDVEALSPAALATMDSIAVFANGLNTAFCALVLWVVWKGLYQGQAWSWTALFIGLGFAWGAGVAADFVVGWAAPWVNAVSFLILALGLLLTGAGLPRAESLDA